MRVLKIGGEVATDDKVLRALAQDIGSEDGWLLVHGGGGEVSALTRRFGIEPEFTDGVRKTSAEEMDYVDMVLAGLVNKRLVRIFQTCGLNAVGLSGADGRLFTGRAVAEGNRTANIDKVTPDVVQDLVRGGYFPVVCSVSMDANGAGLNINADSAALAIAAAVQAETLLFLSDVPGVLKKGQVIQKMTRESTLEEIEKGTITGGMIPKVQASLEALRAGVRSILIGQYSRPGSLLEIMRGEQGTCIVDRM